MSIDLTIGGPDGSVILQKNMARDPKEACGKTLERMRMLFGGGGKKGKDSRQSREEILASLPQATLVGANDTALDTSRPNSEIWRQAKELTLGDHRLHVSYNIPTVTSITPPPTMTVGAPAVCGSITIMFCSEDELFVEWRCEGLGVVSKERVFFPRSAHVGKPMVFRCRPRHPDAMWTEVALPPVMPPTATALAMPRWEHTRERANVTDPKAFRIVSYNVLHDKFCTSNFAKTQIYPFASSSILDLNYRKGVIVSELKAYNSDIILLQECGQEIYGTYYSHALKAMGYTCRYFNKSGLAREGSVIAFNSSRFEVVGGDAVPLTYPTLRAHHAAIADELDQHPHAREGLENMTAVGAIAVLRDRTDRSRLLVVGCTHLFYHPNGCHIRALQAFMMASAMRRIQSQFEAKHADDGVRVHMVLGGDFNFTRPTGAYELLTKGSVAKGRDCWDKGFKFWWGCHHGLGHGEDEGGATDESAEAAEATGDRACAPAAANLSREPPTEVFRADLSLDDGVYFEDTHINEPTLKHTNFTMTFREIIDHIFIARRGNDSEESERLVLSKTIPLPTDEELSTHVAIPNPTFASDHVALVADLTFQ